MSTQFQLPKELVPTPQKPQTNYDPLLAELVFYGAHNYGNYALCGRCGGMCGRVGCATCDGSGIVAGDYCEDCLCGERFWCDDCGEMEGWLPKGQSAPIHSTSTPGGKSEGRQS